MRSSTMVWIIVLTDMPLTTMPKPVTAMAASDSGSQGDSAKTR
jgi:hypothetical protein